MSLGLNSSAYLDFILFLEEFAIFVFGQIRSYNLQKFLFLIGETIFFFDSIFVQEIVDVAFSGNSDLIRQKLDLIPREQIIGKEDRILTDKNWSQWNWKESNNQFFLALF